jgi:hypothetical protein
VKKVYEDGYGKKPSPIQQNKRYPTKLAEPGPATQLEDSVQSFDIYSPEKRTQNPYSYDNKQAYMVPAADRDDKNHEINLDELNELLGLTSGPSNIDKFVH